LNRSGLVVKPKRPNPNGLLRPQETLVSGRHADALADSGDSTEADVLYSWKQIAAHLHRDVRTVQRWEKGENLPIYRHVHKSQASIYAFKTEIDAWRNERSSRPADPAALRIVKASQKAPRSEFPGEIIRSADASAGVPSRVTEDHQRRLEVVFLLCASDSLFPPTVVTLSSPGYTSTRGDRQWNGSHRSTKKLI